VRQSCALDDIIYRALSFVQEPLRLAGVTASFTRSSSEILIEANQTQLEQVFVNLLLNAKDAMHQSTPKRVAITMKEEGRVVTILVEDTGPGIEAGIRAGMQVVGLLTTVVRNQLGCEWIVNDFRDVHLERTENGFEILLTEAS